MSEHSTPGKGYEEDQHLLGRSEFDGIHDLETNGHLNANAFAKLSKKRNRSRNNSWFGRRRTWGSTMNWPLRSIVIGLVVAVTLALLASVAWHNGPEALCNSGFSNDEDNLTAKHHHGGFNTSTAHITNLSSVSSYKKPEGFKIVGLVFFGRPATVEILDCYLKRNLVTNGGFLDEVLFAEHTQHVEDLAWLHELVDTEPLYRSLPMDDGGYDTVWKNSVDNENMFIKIDDDIVKPPFFCTQPTYPTNHPRRSTSATTPSQTSSTPSSNTRKPST